MLISILSNLVMLDGTPIPTPQGGGTGMGAKELSHIDMKKADDLRRKKILDEDEEDWILFIHSFIVENNLN